MSSGKRLDSNKTIITPAARRGGADDNDSKDNQKGTPTILNVIENLQGSEDLKKISTQILKYTDQVENELNQLQAAIAKKDRADTEAHAAVLTGLCSDLGATQMMRLCYQVQIIARQGSFSGAQGLHDDLLRQFSEVKDTLRIA